MEHLGDQLQFLNCFSALQLHQFAAIAGLDPADAKIRYQKSDHVIGVEIGNEGGPMPIAAITADVTSGRDSTILKAFGKSLQAHHQIVHYRSVLLG